MCLHDLIIEHSIDIVVTLDKLCAFVGLLLELEDLHVILHLFELLLK